MKNIPKLNLEFLNNTPNVIDYSQATIDGYQIDEYNRENIIRSIKLLLHRLNHVSVDFLAKKLENRFSDIDFVDLVKYPLPATYNTKTKKVIINMKFFGKKEVTNIDSHMLLSTIFYGYMCRLYCERPVRIETQIEVSDFMSELLIKIFGRKYGIMVSYADMIPRVRFLVISYILTSFYGMEQSKTYIKAGRAGTSYKNIGVNMDEFDLYNVRDFIKLLSESKVFPGINIAEFAGTVMNRYGLIMLPLFEDEMRFMATITAATLPNGGLFPPYLESTNVKLHSKIISNINQYM